MKNNINNFDTIIRSVPEVIPDYTKKYNYKNLIDEEINHYSKIEITDNLHEAGIHCNKSWLYWGYYRDKRLKTSFTQEIITACNNINHPRILSLGCGYGGFELEIADKIKKPYTIIAIDINNEIYRKAQEKADKSVFPITFTSFDLNFIEIKKNYFDVIYAHASLHHVLNLEHLFFQISQGLKEHGSFIVLDIIGKTQTIFWKENVEYAIFQINNMPPGLKNEIGSVRSEFKHYSNSHKQVGMEGIRQEKIETLLATYFSPAKLLKYGSFVRMICTHPKLGKIIDPDIKDYKQYLDFLFSLDFLQIKKGNLRPTELLGVFKKLKTINNKIVISKNFFSSIKHFLFYCKYFIKNFSYSIKLT